MLIIAAVFVIALGFVAFLIVSPKSRLELIDDWRAVHRKASAKLALAAGSLALLPPIAEQVLAFLPQLQAVEGIAWLDAILESAAYRTFVGLLTLFIVVARSVRLPPPDNAGQPQ